jgi:hypothetical protein
MKLCGTHPDRKPNIHPVPTHAVAPRRPPKSNTGRRTSVGAKRAASGLSSLGGVSGRPADGAIPLWRRPSYHTPERPMARWPRDPLFRLQLLAFLATATHVTRSVCSQRFQQLPSLRAPVLQDTTRSFISKIARRLDWQPHFARCDVSEGRATSHFGVCPLRVLEYRGDGLAATVAQQPDQLLLNGYVDPQNEG